MTSLSVPQAITRLLGDPRQIVSEITLGCRPNGLADPRGGSAQVRRPCLSRQIHRLTRVRLRAKGVALRFGLRDEKAVSPFSEARFFRAKGPREFG